MSRKRNMRSLPHYATFFWAILILIVWEGVWKGFALWRAAKNSHLAWFICIIIFNTVGILPIVYYFGFSDKKKVTAPLETPLPK